MHFVLYSETDESSVKERLGHPDSRYYFVLRAFQPALELLGTTEVVRNPNFQVDAIFDGRTARGEDCVFLFFGPPGNIPLGLRCPTVIVLAWEFSTLPAEIWDEIGRSDWRVTLAALGGAIVLSNDAARVLKSIMGEDFPVIAIKGAVWDYFERVRESVSFCPTVPVELHIKGVVFDSLALDLSADRLVPSSRPAGSTPAYVPQLEAPIILDDISAVETTGPSLTVRLEGTVYTTFLDPTTDRKNLHDVLTAFCFAFRDVPDATLVVKVTNWHPKTYREWLMLLLSRLAPFKCRVIAMHAFLDDNAMEKLIRATSYYVNASYCEALCQSLLEFMSCGRPAIAPRHTAMNDYIDEDVAFVLASARENGMWPGDPRWRWRCERFRIEWESLRDAYLQSYRIAKELPEQRAAMGGRAMTRIRNLTRTSDIADRIRNFLTTWRAANALCEESQSWPEGEQA